MTSRLESAIRSKARLRSIGYGIAAIVSVGGSLYLARAAYLIHSQTNEGLAVTSIYAAAALFMVGVAAGNGFLSAGYGIRFSVIESMTAEQTTASMEDYRRIRGVLTMRLSVNGQDLVVIPVTDGSRWQFLGVPKAMAYNLKHLLRNEDVQ